MIFQIGMNTQQYSIVVNKQYSISWQTYDKRSATAIVLSNPDRQSVIVSIITMHPYKRHGTKATTRPEINSAAANSTKR
jgi:hypothetical protein